MMEVREWQWENALCSILVTASDSVTQVRPLHSWKTRIPTFVKLFGSVIEVRAKQQLNVLSPTWFTVSGSETEVRWSQSLKAPSPIVISLVGKMIEVRRKQAPNALSPTWITVSGSNTLSISDGCPRMPMTVWSLMMIVEQNLLLGPHSCSLYAHPNDILVTDR